MAQRAGGQAEQREQVQLVSPIPAKHVIQQVTQQQRTIDYSHTWQQNSFASKQADSISSILLVCSQDWKENSFALEHVASTPLGPLCVDTLDLLRLPLY